MYGNKGFFTMKATLGFLALFISLTGFSKVIIQEEAYILGQKPEVIQELILAGSVEVDHVTSEGFEVYGSKGLKAYLDKKGIPFLDMQLFKHSLSNYPTHEEIERKLRAAEAKNPKIMKLFSIGKSVRGKELWVMKISDNVELDEVEPEFKYISSMHGDEITGRELTTMLIEEIAEKYGRDPEITELVNNTEIYIMPSMNPDGSERRSRANAKGIDLNRNFPDMTRDRESSTAGREVENQAVMNFQASRKFALSANFHGGTIVANYPWDSIYDKHPLDDLVKEFSLGYSERNPEMRISNEFPGGITNGAAWYVVRGGMQDWSYVWFNDLQVTIELSHRKWPDYSLIPGFYVSNRDSMIYYMKQIHQGAGFKMERSNVSGSVEIVQLSPVNRKHGSYAFSGSEFYKVLPDGDYEFVIKEKNKSTSKKVFLRVEKNLIKANGNFLTLR
jgi:hypothetical protein